MNSATSNMYPSSALAALFSSMGRSMLWVLVRAMRAPLTSTIAVIMTLGVISATSNAMFFQKHMHPAPLFGDRAMVTSAPVAEPQKIVTAPPVRMQPVERSARVPAPQYTAPAPQMPKAVSDITHAEIKLAQERLASLGLYADKPDGYYGPNTAAAIRAFEAENGLPGVGALTPQILTQINAAQPLVAREQPQTPIAPQTIVQPKRDDLGQLVDSVTKDVENGSRQLTAMANTVTQNVTREIASATKPDRLEQIAQKVATLNKTKQPVRQSANDPAYVKRVQSGLASLGFLQGRVDGVAGEDTAKAIRNFEVYYNYNVTGAITPGLIDLLAEAGAKL